MTIENIAEICHEANAAYCRALGDSSQPSWASAPDWQRNSAVNGVRFKIEHPEAPPSAQHEAWLEQKRTEGWKYGPVKNPEKKEHPCFIPYTGLPLEQRAKDHLFCAIVIALAPFVTR